MLAYLWPSRDEEHARHSLAQLIYAMRQTLHRQLISGDSEFRLDHESLTSDVSEFLEKTTGAARLCALYAGPFLDGFHLPDSPDFDQWAERERDRTAVIAGNALEKIARDASARGDHTASVESWRRRVALSPFESGCTIGLMKALAAAGDKRGAIRQARVYKTLLESEEEMEADPRVDNLASRIQRKDVQSRDGARGRSLAAVAAVLWPHAEIPQMVAVGDIDFDSGRDTSASSTFANLLSAAVAGLPGINILSSEKVEGILSGAFTSDTGNMHARGEAWAIEVFEGKVDDVMGTLELELRRIDLRSGTVRRLYRVNAVNLPALATAATRAIAADFGIAVS